MSVVKRVLSGALCVMLTAGFLAAENRTFHGGVEVNIVTLKVVVTNLWETRPVAGLTRDNFVVLENGEEREITHFAEISEGRAIEPIEMLDTEDLVPPPITPDRQRLVVLAFDLRTLLLPRLDRAAKKLISFIEGHPDDNLSWSVVLLGSEARCLLAPTFDRAAVGALLNALIEIEHPSVMRTARTGSDLLAGMTFDDVPGAGIPGSGPLPGMADGEIPYRSSLDRLVRQLDIAEQEMGQQGMIRSLATTFRSFAAAPGVKSLILFYARDIDHGMISAPATGSVVDSLSDLAAFEGRWRGLGRVASAAGFTLYAANVVGPQIPLGPDRESLSIEHATRILAVETGGGHVESNNPALAVKRAISETARYYEISFSAPRVTNGVHRDLKVKVRARGVHRVRHSTGGYVIDPRFRIVDQLSTPADFPKSGGALTLEQDLELVAQEGGRTEVVIRPSLDLDQITFVSDGEVFRAALDLFVAVHDESNKIIALKHAREYLRLPLEWQGSRPSIYRPTVRLAISKGRHTVTTALYDMQSELSGMASGSVLVKSIAEERTEPPSS